MATLLLQTGDVFELKVGDQVYCGGHDCIVGKKTYHEQYTKDKIVVKGRSYFSEDYLKKVAHPVPKPGKYIVLCTERSGGGYGMGSHDVFPDGHKVFARPVQNKSRGEVAFYQTGCFTCMVENPTIIKRKRK